MHRGVYMLLAATAVSGCASTQASIGPQMSFPPSFERRIANSQMSEAAIFEPSGMYAADTTESRFASSRSVKAAKVFEWDQDKIIPIKVACCGSFTMIHLGKGETHTGEKVTAFGDPHEERWQAMGSNTADTEVVVVGARNAGQKTTMLITTQIRAYQFQVTSVPPGKDDKIIKFTFPDPAAAKIKQRKSLQYDPALVDNNYTIKVVDGNTPQWLPLSVFTLLGGTKTWIEFADTPGRIGAPLAFVQYSDSSELYPVTVRRDGSFYEVDAQFSAAELVLGETRIRIEKKSS